MPYHVSFITSVKSLEMFSDGEVVGKRSLFVVNMQNEKHKRNKVEQEAQFSHWSSNCTSQNLPQNHMAKLTKSLCTRY